MLYRQDMQFQQALSKIDELYSEFDDAALLSSFCKRSERGIIR